MAFLRLDAVTNLLLLLGGTVETERLINSVKTALIHFKLPSILCVIFHFLKKKMQCLKYGITLDLVFLQVLGECEKLQT